ncbi:hypothetical protein [Oricola indica]|uniref:hypothetical protein n=1 Tax=Oricola indica TaxID=2872591 RepID=UPI003CCBA159
MPYRFRLAAASSLIAIGAFSTFSPAKAQSLVDVCTGLSVDIPLLNPVTDTSSGLLSGLLDPVLNAIIGDVNTNIVDVLSQENIGLTVLDEDNNPVTSSDNCNLVADDIVIDEDAGIAIGGGTVSSLGGTSNPLANAGEINSIAIGNDADTDPTATSAIALGLRGSVDAVDGVAIGRDSSTTAEGGVAIGADSTADRAGMGGGAEDFSGTAVASTTGAFSVGSAGNERQITNVAGGTEDTDAVNVRQLRTVGNDLAGAIGGGAGFDATTGIFTGPSYTIRGSVYNDVGSALAALDSGFGVIAANNTSGYADASATGDDALATGYGSSAGGSEATAYGTSASAGGAGATAVGTGATADEDGSTAIGAGAKTTRAGQMSFGTAANTYTMSGVSSAASLAAQSGPVGIVTSDAGGNLATVAAEDLLADIINNFDSDVTELSNRIDDVRTESRQGIAAAMSMAQAPMPSAPGRTTWAANVATFKGEWASGFAVAHRLPGSTPVSFNAAMSLNATGVPGARAGLSGEF